jgi:hypothetical protein
MNIATASPLSFKFLESSQGVRARLRAHNPVLLAVVATQISGYRAGHGKIVVDGQHHGFAKLPHRVRNRDGHRR